MKATPYIQAIEDCIVLLNEIQIFIEATPIEYIYGYAEKPMKEKVENMLSRLNDLKVEYYFQKDNKISLEKPTNFEDVKV